MRTLFLFFVVLTSFIPTRTFVPVGSYTKTSIVSLAFDDGNTNQFLNALPILDSMGFKATFYIVTKYLAVTKPSVMNKDQVLQLYADGQEIGSHSKNHINLAFCWPWIAKEEIEQSKKDLNAIGIKVTSFAYPEGASNFLSRYYVSKADYINGRGTPRDGYNGTNTDKFNLCCKYVVNTTTANEIKAWVDDAAKKGYWLILLFHVINESNSTYKYSCTRNTFREACVYLKNRNSTILPVSQAFKKYFPAFVPEN